MNLKKGKKLEESKALSVASAPRPYSKVHNGTHITNNTVGV
jgi:hypothetical protein